MSHLNAYNCELIGEDKTKIKVIAYDSAYNCIKDLVRIDVIVEPGTVDFLRKNKVFYLEVNIIEVLGPGQFEDPLEDQWVRLKQRIKKCNRSERLNWKAITFIAKPLTNLEVLQELHKDDVVVEE